MDQWVLSLHLETAVLERLSKVANVRDRRDIVQASRNSISRIRCMGAFFNGCITKTLQAQQYCESHAQLTGKPLPTAGGEASSSRPSVSPGMAENHQASKFPSPELPSDSRLGGCVAAETRRTSTDSAEPSPCNDDAPAWQAWSGRALASADQKSKFMREVLAVLDPSVASGVAALPGQWPFTVGCAVALLACDGQSPKATAPVLLRSYLQTLGRQSLAASTITSVCSAHKFVIVHYGALCGLSHLAFRAALTTVLAANAGTRIEIYEVHSLPSCPTSHAVEQQSLTNLSFRVNLLGDTSHWPRLCRDRKQHWVSEGVRLLVFYAVDARESLPVVSVDTVGSNQRLHSPTNAEFWRLLAGLKYLSPDFTAANMSVLSWNAADWECTSGDALDQWLGPALAADPFRYKCPQSLLTFRAVPPLHDVTGRCAGADVNSVSEGWCWLPAVRKQPRAELRQGPWSPGALQLFDVIIFNERELLSSEKQFVRSCQRVHAESSQIRLLDVPRVCAFFDVPHASVGMAFAQHLPCLGSILRATGTACDAASEASVECGAERWCLNCEQALRLLWCSPPLGLLCDYMASWMNAVLLNGLQATSSTTSASWQSLPDHKCSEACAGVSGVRASSDACVLTATVQGSGEVTAGK